MNCFCNACFPTLKDQLPFNTIWCRERKRLEQSTFNLLDALPEDLLGMIYKMCLQISPELRYKQLICLHSITKKEVIYNSAGGRCPDCFAESFHTGYRCRPCQTWNHDLEKYCFDEAIDGINICSFGKQKSHGRRHGTLFKVKNVGAGCVTWCGV